MRYLLIILLATDFFSIASDKWIVITTINYPTTAIKKLAAMKDWQLLVVADKKTPADWHLDNCIFLSPQNQQELPYKIIAHLPWNHYARKNVGYLYAIAHGAKIIYETDDDNEYLSDSIETLPESMQLDCCYTKNHIANVYAHFGQQSVWPRGFPLTAITRSSVPTLTRNMLQITIQQGLVNYDPDVDAIYRLTHDKPIYFSEHAPLALNKGVFCPFNSQNTLFHYNAFWALLMPISVAMRVTDIWRSYWTQRIMWEHNQHLCFTKATALQYRNAHNLLDDFAQEQDLYLKTESLIHCLLSWQPTNTHIFTQMTEIIQLLAQNNFVGQTDVALMAAWIGDLKSIGYKEFE
jgi:hypothetical protein